MDGSYIADGRQVRRKPTKTATGFTMGCVVCEVSEFISDDAAKVIAEALNMHRAAHPENH